MNILTDDTINDVLKSHRFGLIKFGANWCGPCKVASQQLKALTNKIEMFEVNVDDNPELVKQNNISSIPVIQIFKNNNDNISIIYESVGNVNIPEIEKIIEDLNNE